MAEFSSLESYYNFPEQTYFSYFNLYPFHWFLNNWTLLLTFFYWNKIKIDEKLSGRQLIGR